jgi:hypothetical protein
MIAVKEAESRFIQNHNGQQLNFEAAAHCVILFFLGG